VRQRLIDESGGRTYVVILEDGEEVGASLIRFAQENHLGSSSINGIGALSGAQVGWFDWKTKSYKPATPINEQAEVLSMIGDISMQNGTPVLNLHLVVRRQDGTAYGGHLFTAHANPALEVILRETTELRRNANG
jgi:predicted DNA-binding protein with PD1-like motif